MKLKKILFYCNFPPPNTGQTVGTKLVKDLLDDEFETEVLNTSSNDFNIGRGFLGKIKRLKKVVSDLNKLKKKLAEDNYDYLYIVASGSLLGHLRDNLILKIANSKVDNIVAHVRSGNYGNIFKRKWHSGLTRSFVEKIDDYIFLSERLSQRVEGNIPSEKRNVVYNSIDRAVWCTSEEIASKVSTRSNQEKFVVTYLSNMIKTKGYFDLAKALKYYRENYKGNITARFIGMWPDNETKNSFWAWVQKYNLSGSIEVLGRIDNRKKVRSYLIDSDAFALPTYYPVEAQPRSIIEALNAANPIIATNHASIPEYVFDGDNGYLIDKKSPLQIAESIRKLQDKDVWSMMAREARNTYEDMFSPQAIKSELVKVFSQ